MISVIKHLTDKKDDVFIELVFIDLLNKAVRTTDLTLYICQCSILKAMKPYGLFKVHLK
jgi:hypothetical protein